MSYPFTGGVFQVLFVQTTLGLEGESEATRPLVCFIQGASSIPMKAFTKDLPSRAVSRNMTQTAQNASTIVKPQYVRLEDELARWLSQLRSKVFFIPRKTSIQSKALRRWSLLCLFEAVGFETFSPGGKSGALVSLRSLGPSKHEYPLLA